MNETTTFDSRQVMSSFLPHVRRFLSHRVLGRCPKPPVRISEILTPRIQELAIKDAARVADRFFSDFLDEKRADQHEQLFEIARNFFALFPDRPSKTNSGGSGFENLFWLYLTCRFLEPDLMVESGIWRGQSSWVMRQACPLAEFHAFDIDFSMREYVDESIQYHEHDWTEYDFGDVSERSTLVFFDDHINHMRRLEESRARGFRTLVLDDNLPVYHIFQEMEKMVPTVDMLFDDDLIDGEEIEWMHWSRIHKAQVDLPAWRSTRAKVRRYDNFPLVDNLASNAASKGRYGGTSKLAFVELL